ncbi:MAG TPA: tetratricopeptide repeat protein [Opitutaceae bacterium]|nr:tetratricopeptide repeat protein [Opitutaceae bacterium]
MPVPSPRVSAARSDFGLAALVGLAGLWAYWPALKGPFLWDDVAEIPQNPVLRDPHGLARIWLGQAGPDYFPLKSSLQWIFWHSWGNHPLPYHLVSLGLHLLAALLFLRLLRRLGVAFPEAGALLFALHPLAVESVAWIAEFKNVLSEVFLIGAANAYVGFDLSAGPRSRRCYGMAVGRFALALLSKSSVVMFPGAILLYAWWRRGRLRRKDVRASLPFFGLSLLLGLVTVSFQYHRALAQWAVPLHGLGPHLVVAGFAVWFYLGKCLLPLGLHPMYAPWEVASPGLAQWIPFAALALFAAGLWTQRGKAWGRATIFGLGFFLLNLLPVLGFLPMSYMHVGWVADHFAYLSLLGVAGLAAAALGRLGPRRVGWIVLAAIGLALAWTTHSDAARFRDEQVLWSSVLRENPRAWMADVDLGRCRAQAGDYAAAVDYYGKALAVRADLPEAYYNRGLALMNLGRLPESEADFNRALQLQPDSPDALDERGNVQARSGRLPEAVESYRAALRLDPTAADVRSNLVRALLYSVPELARQRRLPEAEAACEEVLQLDPGRTEAHADLGNLLWLQGRLPEAVEQYETVLRAEPANAAIRANLERARSALQAAGVQ